MGKNETKKLYQKIKTNINPNDLKYQQLQNELVENLEKDKFAYQINTFNHLTYKDKWSSAKQFYG